MMKAQFKRVPDGAVAADRHAADPDVADLDVADRDVIE